MYHRRGSGKMEWIKNNRSIIKKNAIILFIVGVLISYGVYLDNNFLEQLNSDSSSSEKYILVDGMVAEKPSPRKFERNYKELMGLMLQMGNTKVISEEGSIWGKRLISKFNINKARKLIKKYNYKDEEYLLSILNDWEKGDFKDIENQYNYILENIIVRTFNG
jgi:hypothetical protein